MHGAEETLVPGHRLDRYELLCPVASGGMASVWLARLLGKRGFEKLFAIKTIRTELITDPQFQAMFLDEARIASRIIHPNVAQIIELGEQDDILYIVMEYVDGDSLAKVHRLGLKSGAALPLGVALRIIADMCAGLHAAHQLKDSSGVSLNVVHRDVSPQNVLVTTDGNAKVIDFGLVKARGRSVGETGHGVVKGKIRYMAPEQVGSKSIDHRADIWAVGMCLYELLAGHVPYHAEDDLDVVKRLMSNDPLPEFDVEMPPPVERIVKRALVSDPVGRYESCAQMKRAIEAAIAELQLQADNEHVAAFLEEKLPDLASKRHAMTTKATQGVSDSRVPVSPPVGDIARDIGFAATEVSRRAKGSEPPPTVRQGAAHVVDSDSRSEASPITTTNARRLRDQLGEEKKRGKLAYVLAAAVTVGAGAWILWPRPEPPAPTQQEPARPAPSASVASPASIELPATPAPTTVASAEPQPVVAIELDASVELDGGAGRVSTPGHSGSLRWPAPEPPSSAAPARTFNPAWSILTNPPDAGESTSPAPAPSPAYTIQE